jgi:MoxR-like ATPase
MPPAPPWRRFAGTGPECGDDDALAAASDDAEAARRLGPNPVPFGPDGQRVVTMVNAAIHLRRALLVTGSPGIGKSTLAYLIARELRLGPVLRWPITTRTTLQAGLYRYDALARLQAIQAHEANREGDRVGKKLASQKAAPPSDDGFAQIGRFVQLGPLGTALLPRRRPRVVLLDEIDKSDIDLPDDLLNVLEEGTFEIPELARHEDHKLVRVRTADRRTALVERGQVTCLEFPLIVMTSNKERDFPPAFMRRCLRVTMDAPEDRVRKLVEAHLGADWSSPMVQRFVAAFDQADTDTGDGAQSRSPDQLLNALFIVTQNAVSEGEADDLAASLFQPLEN